jgi:Domain of unknown function (DUF4878)
VAAVTRPVLASVAALVLGAGLAGCIVGAGGPDDAVNDFAAAVADEDFGAACGYLSEEIQSAADAQGGCEAALEAGLTDEDIADAETLEAETVEEDGDTAVVETSSEAEGTQEVELTKEDGDWKISGLP